MNQNHHDFKIRQEVVHIALQWLLAINRYHQALGISLDVTALEQLPLNGIAFDINTA